MRNWYFLFCLMVIALLSPSCNNKQVEQQGAATSEQPAVRGGQASVVDETSKKNIIQIAAASTDHTTLAAAVKAAGLSDVLANPGPLTVFAPNNAAFEKLPAGTVEELLKPENKAKLAKIITGHAAAGTYKPAELTNGSTISMATGDNVTIEVKDGLTLVNGANVLGSVEASNGFVYVIDAVILYPDK
ncbi:MAG: fasciclin domain-containing protein [Cyclobacteriaceae bacterium]|nr:fasciclin domain-containing protein [Cyclobacteriaceae bacterium]